MTNSESNCLNCIEQILESNARATSANTEAIAANREAIAELTQNVNQLTNDTNRVLARSAVQEGGAYQFCWDCMGINSSTKVK